MAPWSVREVRGSRDPPKTSITPTTSILVLFSHPNGKIHIISPKISRFISPTVDAQQSFPNTFSSSLDAIPHRNSSPGHIDPLFLALSSQEASKLPGILGKRDNDNSSSIASELYGTGVRLGIYLQSIGMIISYPRKLSKKIAGIGVQLAAATVLIAFLASWTILVREQEISSCEAWLVLTLLWALSAGLGVATTGQPLRGEYFVTLLSYGADIWAAVAAMWFWVDLSRSLPELGTKNLVFMFAPVDVTHWFRVFDS